MPPSREPGAATMSETYRASVATPDTAAPRRRLRLTAEEHRRLARRHRARRTLRAYGFLAPNLVFFSIFLLLPCGWVVYSSFHTGGVLGPAEYVGLENWKEAFKDPMVLKTIRNTLLYTVLAIPAVFVLGMALALALQNVTRGGKLVRGLLYFPTLMPVVLAALIWVFVVHPEFGLLNVSFRLAGQKSPNWLGNPNLALPTITMLEVWRGTGFYALLFLASLLALPRELFQAAHLDGAGAVQRFRHLTLPLMRSTFLFALVMATIWNLQLFDSVLILTDGGPLNNTATIVWFIYKSLFSFGNVGYAAVLSCLLLLLILALTFVQFRLLGRRGRA
jgi:ABC-type sugar transport system permease subunit